MTDAAKGVLALIAAGAIWGLSPLYYKLLVSVPPLELLAHRTLWSALCFAAVLGLQRRLATLWAVFRDGRTLAIIAFCAAMISVNWFLFILSIQIGRTTETSLGYYIFPLVAVALGMIFLRERPGRLQLAAVALAALAVIVLTLGLGVAPWISLAIALSFGFYGVIKKTLDLGPVVSVTAEVIVLAPLAVAWLLWVHGTDPGGAFGQDTGRSLLLMLSGLLTAGPLILFSYGARRVSMTTLGLVQYLNPTLQFFCAVVVFGEPFGHVHALAFAMIWVALAIYSIATWAQDRARRNASVVSATDAQTLTKSRSDASAKP